MDRIRKELSGTVGCRVEIRTPEVARSAAQRLAHIFNSCGYPSQIVVEESDREGVHIECSSEHAESALSIQSAFQSADYEVTLAMHEGARRNLVVIQLPGSGIK